MENAHSIRKIKAATKDQRTKLIVYTLTMIKFMQPKSNPSREDLQWQAFLYAAGELSATDAAIFEALLADNYAAQEALVEAMTLNALVSTAVVGQKVELANSSENAFLSKWPMVWGSLLSVALLVTTYMTNFSDDTLVSSTKHAELAELWSRQLTEADLSSNIDSVILDDAADSDLVSSENSFPSWMLDAIRASESVEISEDNATEEMES